MPRRRFRILPGKEIPSALAANPRAVKLIRGNRKSRIQPFVERMPAAFREVWNQPASTREHAQLSHLMEESLFQNISEKTDSRIRERVQNLVHGVTRNPAMSSQMLLDAALRAKTLRSRGQSLTGNVVADTLLTRLWERTLTGSALTLYFMRIFHAQGLNASPRQIMEALPPVFGSARDNNQLMVRKEFGEPPRPEQIRQVEHAVIAQQKSARTGLWKRQLEHGKSKRAIEAEKKSSLIATFKHLYIPRAERRKLQNKMIKLWGEGKPVDNSEIRKAALSISLRRAREILRSIGYSTASETAVLERMGIFDGSPHLDERLFELHFNLHEGKTPEQKRKNLQELLASTNYTKSQEVELAKKVHDLDRAPRIARGEIEKLTDVLRKSIKEAIPPNVLKRSLEHIVLWNIANSTNVRPLEQDIQLAVRTERYGIKFLDLLNDLRDRGLVQRKGFRCSINDPKVLTQYGGKPGVTEKF